MQALRVGLVALMIAIGIVAPATAVAQDDTATEAAAQVEDVATEDEDDGFEWGLLGLLGLAGLAGLLKRPERHEVQRVDRVDTDVRRRPNDPV